MNKKVPRTILVEPVPAAIAKSNGVLRMEMQNIRYCIPRFIVSTMKCNTKNSKM